MKAVDLNADINCPVCGGSGDEPWPHEPERAPYGGVCPRCDGDGTINRDADGDPTSPHFQKFGDDLNAVVLEEVYDADENGAARQLRTLPVEHDKIGGFDAMFGDFVPSDPRTELPQDMLDRLTNTPLSTNTDTNGKHQVFNIDGQKVAEYGKEDLHNGVWPEDCPNCPADGLCPNHAITWTRARGQEKLATILTNIKAELGL